LAGLRGRGRKKLGSLLLGYYRDGKLVCASHAGTGMT
jgi:hypothetical protein